MKQTTGRHYAIGLPLLMAFDAVLFVFAMFSEAATANLYLMHANGTYLYLGTVETFGVLAAVSDFWKQGLYPIAAMVFGFSVVLPYAKLLVSLIIFWGPISDEGHDWMIKILDTLGKWSLLDSWMILVVVSLVSMKVTLTSGQGFAIAFEAQLGYFAYFVATILLLVIGNLLLLLHRRAHRVESDAPLLKSNSRLSLLCGKPEVGRVTFSLLLVVSVVLLWTGAATTLCSIELQGFVGWSLSFLGKYDQRLQEERGLELHGDGSSGNIWSFRCSLWDGEYERCQSASR
jgi:hypothetical protein